MVSVALTVATAMFNRNHRIVQGGARNVIPLIVHVTHFYYYKKEDCS